MCVRECVRACVCAICGSVHNMSISNDLFYDDKRHTILVEAMCIL